MTTRWFLALSLALALPAGAAQAARPQPAPSVVYEVKKGDTFYDLARLYLVRPSAANEIQRLNRVANARRLPVGRRLTVPVRLLRSEEIVGTLTAFGGKVSVRGPGVGDVRKNMEIREGYELATGPNAFLTFELPDGSRTTLPSQSRMKVEGLKRILLTGALQRDLKLEAGRSNSVVTPMIDKDSRFRIQTPLTVSAVRGTQFRVNHDAAAGRSTIEVIEGKVAETRNGAETLVVAGYGLDTNAQSGSRPQPLLPQPLLNEPGRLQDDQQLGFQLQPQPAAMAYRAQIAPDAGFIDMVAEVTSDTPNLSFETLPNGTFFARFTAIDGSGLEGLPATYAFERRLNALRLEAPVTMSAGAKEQYLFKWLSTGGAPETFRFVLTRDGGARPVIDEAGLKARQIVVTRLPPGAYSWRVLVSRIEDGRLYEKWSPVQQFEIGG